MWLVVTDVQLIASLISYFPVNSVHIGLERALILLYCFAPNQGHCMLIKSSADRLNRINAQAHNQCYSHNIFKWPHRDDDLILLSNTARQDVSLVVEPVSPRFPLRQEPPSYGVAQPCSGEEIVRECRLIRKRHSSLFTRPFLISDPDQFSITVSRAPCVPSIADRWDLPLMQTSLFVAMATKSPACCRLSCQPPPPCSSSPICTVL